MPLTLIDLLKSYYLREAVKSVEDEHAVSKWEELITLFHNDNDEPISSVITQFLQNSYDTFEGKTSSSITKNESLRKYETLFSEYKAKYIQTLIYRAKIFSLISPLMRDNMLVDIQENTHKLLTKLSKLESTQVYPIIFYLLDKYHNGSLSTGTLNKVLNWLVNYYVRRNLVLKPKSSNIRAKAIQSVREFNKHENELDLYVFNIVKTNLGSIASSDIEFEQALRSSVYDTSKQTARLILIDLERRYGKSFNKQNPDTLDETTEKGMYIWTLEHILPQTSNLNEDWLSMLKKETDNPEKIELIKAENIHKFGNLTLTGYNSEMSSRSFKEKRDYKTKNTNTYTGLRTNLFLNESIPEKEYEINEKETWSIKDIKRRTEELAEIIFELYKI